MLNFLPISPDKFEFDILRKIYDEKDIKINQVFKYKLPKNDNYTYYSVSFDKIEGFEKFRCSENTNIYLTVRYLWNILKKNLNTKTKELNFEIFENNFNRCVDIILDSNNYGNKTITLQPYYFKKINKYGFLIDYRFKRNEGIIFNKEIQRLSLSLDKNYRSNVKYYSDKFSVYHYFIKNFISIISPLIENGLNLKLNQNLISIEGHTLDTKTYICKDNKRSNSQFMGVKKHGPFEELHESVEYIFMFEQRFRNFANDVYLGLVGRKFSGLFPGVSQVFNLKLQTGDITHVPINGYDKKSLDAAFKNVLKIIKLKPDKKIITILILPEEDISFNNTRVYYYFKYLFFKNRFQLQVLTYNKLNNFNALKWAIANIALQIFSKLGGIPWIVEPSHNKCLILGIGSAHKKDDDGRIRKYFAYSVCLDSSGIFKSIKILSQQTDKNKYLKMLEKELINTISNEIKAGYEKCVIHIPFKIRKDEINSIKQSVCNINSDSDIEFRVIKINTENKFFGFSDHNTKIPYESTYVELSDEEYLVWFEGLNYGKENVYKKVGNPVHIKFLRGENEDKSQDISYLQDVINLSGANWRGFNSKLTPISIYYASLIAKYTKEFEFIDGSKSINEEICSITSPWFL